MTQINPTNLFVHLRGYKIENSCDRSLQKLNSLNPGHMRDLFWTSKNRTPERLRMNIESKKFKQISYAKNGLRVQFYGIVCLVMPNHYLLLKPLKYLCKNRVLMGVRFIKSSCHMLKQQNNS